MVKVIALCPVANTDTMKELVGQVHILPRVGEYLSHYGDNFKVTHAERGQRRPVRGPG